MIKDTQTKKVADLIKINIPDNEIKSYTKQLSTVIESVDILKELDTSKTEITSQTHGLTNVLREDRAEPGLDITKYPNTLNLQNNYFLVDKVL